MILISGGQESHSDFPALYKFEEQDCKSTKVVTGFSPLSYLEGLNSVWRSKYLE